jgi:mono/diheme cytochrome c family protein
MHDQPKYKPFRASTFFGDERSARPLVEDTVARGHLKDDSLLYTGKEGGQFANVFPFPIDEQALRRGRERYEIYCAPCHGLVGKGDGMVVQRGFRNRPVSFHIERLQQAPAGYYFDAMTNGFGAMQDYAAQIPVADRWKIVAYVRALQLSQNATLEMVPDQERKNLQAERAR